MKNIQLGTSDLHVSPICLGTMTFGEQVDEATSHALLSHAVERGVTFWDTAEMYAVPPRAETFQVTETYLGHWIAKNPQLRQKLTIATKVAGPSRGMPWVRGGSMDLTAADIVAACDGSLKRLNTDVIDLYQLHWPTRNLPLFGMMAFDPSKDRVVTSMHTQLEALGQLVKAGKVRAVGLSNESAYGVCEFVRLAEQHGLPRVATVQNAYNLLNRTHENGLDEAMHRLNVSLLAYSPLAYGLLTGKYDASGITGPDAPAQARITMFESTRKQRWGRPEALVAARRYNALAQAHGLTPTRMALAYCYTKWQVASTIIGVTTQAQLDENIDAYGTLLAPELLKAIDAVRWEIRDPAL
ncbi:MAG: aldo/keto reductase [Rhodoferax sp.]|nr:aldo/keto reductase [Rhodoferax sp.]